VVTDLRLTLGSGQIYQAGALLTGFVYGALGGVWASRSHLAAPIAVGLAFICEPALVWLLVQAELWGGGVLLQHHWLWIAELLIGLGVVAFVVARAQRAQPRGTSGAGAV
jgi:hypothetical protein